MLVNHEFDILKLISHVESIYIDAVGEGELEWVVNRPGHAKVIVTTKQCPPGRWQYFIQIHDTAKSEHQHIHTNDLHLSLKTRGLIDD